jgi:diketogulonate reductase-like aldo/keto reductase
VSVEPGQPVRELAHGVRMPVLGLGVWQIPSGRETEQAVEWALESGYRHVDTATWYRNEGSVGAAIARSGLPRDQLFVTTKWLPLLRSPAVELQRSLARLRLDHVDLYLIHWPVPLRTSRAWNELVALRERGLARAVGVSNYGIDRLTGMLGGEAPAVDQVQFSPFRYRRRLLEFCEQHGIVLEAYSPLERGKVEHPVIAQIARRLDRTPAQVMLRWSVQRGAVVIPKSTHRDRIVSNARIFDFELDSDDMRALDGLDRTGGTGQAR